MVACVRPPLGRAPVPPLGLPIQSTTSTIFYYYHYCCLLSAGNISCTGAHYYYDHPRLLLLMESFLCLIPLAPLQCTARYRPPSVLGQQYENLAHVELTSKASQCHPQLVTVNRPLLKKKCLPGFHSAINVAAVE